MKEPKKGWNFGLVNVEALCFAVFSLKVEGDDAWRVATCAIATFFFPQGGDHIHRFGVVEGEFEEGMVFVEIESVEFTTFDATNIDNVFSKWADFLVKIGDELLHSFLVPDGLRFDVEEWTKIRDNDGDRSAVRQVTKYLNTVSTVWEIAVDGRQSVVCPFAFVPVFIVFLFVGCRTAGIRFLSVEYMKIEQAKLDATRGCSCRRA